ncbi:NUDIX hydrolase [Desertibaculum subflavum]|uniref:NUDIX hydrolase n=1 Tax=Desertibaculum subflavum TaxID=2268458 RepID=UPI0013C534BF
MAEAPKRPVTPRSAGSLVVVREAAGGPEILLGRRAGRHRFMPDVFVFPGGRLDANDRAIDPVRPLPAATLAQVTRHTDAVTARALAVAAVRETFEETGLALGQAEAGAFRPDLGAIEYLGRAITPSRNPIRFHARFFLTRVGNGAARLGGSGELLDLDWYPMAAALKLPIVDVTEFMLSEVAAHLGPDSARRQLPIFGYFAGKMRIRRE